MTDNFWKFYNKAAVVIGTPMVFLLVAIACTIGFIPYAVIKAMSYWFPDEDLGGW